MKELIDKYVRKRIRIEGNIIHIDTTTLSDFADRLIEVFDLEEFNLCRWVAENITDVFTLVHCGIIDGNWTVDLVRDEITHHPSLPGQCRVTYKLVDFKYLKTRILWKR